MDNVDNFDEQVYLWVQIDSSFFKLIIITAIFFRMSEKNTRILSKEIPYDSVTN